MISEEMMKQMPHMMNNAMQMMHKPPAKGALLAAGGLAAGRSLGLLRNPLALLAAGLAAGVAAGFLAHKYRQEIVDGLGKFGGMGRDFALRQKENLADLMAEAEDGPAVPPTTGDTPPAA